tara:strand:+ start:974 stop:1906 length:933 start_codon:yes stop_codon:yes gene_type:complete
VYKLNDENTYFYIHIDLKCDIKDYQEKFDLPNVFFLKTREQCAWGDISLVDATIHGMRAVLKDKRKGYCIFISGQDYPIKNNTAINDYLKINAGFDFIDLKPINKLWNNNRMRCSMNFYKFNLSNTRNDLVLIPSIFCKEFYSMYTLKQVWRVIKKVWRVIKKGDWGIINIIKPRNFPNYFTPFAGSQWWALTTSTIEKVLSFLEADNRYMQYHRFSFCADEFLFHSIINYLCEKGQVKLKTNLTFVNWDEVYTKSPQIIKANDLEKIKRMPTHKLFARKFDMSVDENIFDQIDNYIENVKQKQKLIRWQ